MLLATHLSLPVYFSFSLVELYRAALTPGISVAAIRFVHRRCIDEADMGDQGQSVATGQDATLLAFR